MIGPRQNSGLRDYRLSTFCELHGKDLTKFKELFGYKGRFQRMYCLLEILPEFSHEQILRWWYKQRFRKKDNKALAIIGSILVRQYVYIICISPFKTTTKPCPFSSVFFACPKNRIEADQIRFQVVSCRHLLGWCHFHLGGGVVFWGGSSFGYIVNGSEIR